MPNISTNSPDGSPAQNALLFYGRPAVIASTWKAYASLANNQTFIIPENSSGSPSLVTFEIEKAASGWTPTGGAVVAIDCTAAATLAALLVIVRDFLNARPNAAYVWSINGTNDGLVGTAKFAGTPWNIAPTGTTITSAEITTPGESPIADSQLSIVSPGIATTNGAVAGDIVRMASASEITPAIADSLANIANIAGVWDGSKVVPLSGYAIINFDVAMLLGDPAYLSQSTAGKCSPVPTFNGANPLGAVVAVLTSGTDYKALVHLSTVGSFSGATAEDIQKGISAALSGCDPRLAVWKYDDYCLQSAPTGMTVQQVLAYNVNGVLLNTNGFALHLNLFKGLSVARWGSWKWAFGARTRLESNDSDYFAGLGNGAEIFGLRFSYTLGVRLYYGAGSVETGTWPATYQQILQPQALSVGVVNTLGIASRGDDTFYVRAGSQVLGPYTISSAVTSPAAFGTVYNYNIPTSGGTVTNSSLWWMSQHRAWL